MSNIIAAIIKSMAIFVTRILNSCSPQIKHFHVCSKTDILKIKVWVSNFPDFPKRKVPASLKRFELLNRKLLKTSTWLILKPAKRTSSYPFRWEFQILIYFGVFSLRAIFRNSNFNSITFKFSFFEIFTFSSKTICIHI